MKSGRGDPSASRTSMEGEQSEEVQEGVAVEPIECTFGICPVAVDPT